MDRVQRFEAYVARLKAFNWNYNEIPEGADYDEAVYEIGYLQVMAIKELHLSDTYKLMNPRMTKISEQERNRRLEEIRQQVKLTAVEELIAPTTTEAS